MILPLSQHVGLLQAGQLSQSGGAEKPGEIEHDGDADDGAAGGAAVNSARMGMLPSYLGLQVNTLA